MRGRHLFSSFALKHISLFEAYESSATAVFSDKGNISSCDFVLANHSGWRAAPLPGEEPECAKSLWMKVLGLSEELN